MANLAVRAIRVVAPIDINRGMMDCPMTEGGMAGGRMTGGGMAMLGDAGLPGGSSERAEQMEKRMDMMQMTMELI